MTTTATLASATRKLTPEEESIRCTICGLGASPNGWNAPASHVVTTVLPNGASRRGIHADHDPVLDNVGPDGKVYVFGRIVATETMGPYTIATVERVLVDGSVETTYTGYIASEAIVAEGWSGGEGGIKATGHGHKSLDECLAFLMAYRRSGPNIAQVVAPHYLRGLGD